jgi:hypothetical protein
MNTPGPDDPLFEALLVKGRPSDDAIAVGRLVDLLTPMPGSLGREQLADAAQTLRDFVEEHRQYAARLQQIESDLADVKADMQQIIGDFGDYLSAMKAEQEEARQRQARADARRRIEDSLPDPDAPVGAYPAPSLQPSLREEGEEQGAYGRFPDEDGPQMPGKPAELPQDRPDAEGDPDPDLPEGVGIAGIPSMGTMPGDLEDLGHPQPSKQTPFAFGGP